MQKMGWKFVILIILAAVIFLWLIKAPVLSMVLTQKLRVPIFVEWVSVGFDHTDMRNFKIKNPEGFKAPDAFTVKETTVDSPWRQMFGNPCVIDQILLNDIFVDVEFVNALGSKNNWTEISDKMPKPRSDREVLIQKMILTNINIEIRGLGLMAKPTLRHVDRLEFEGIDSQQGFPTEELIHKVFGESGLEEFINDAFNPGGLLKDTANPLKIL